MPFELLIQYILLFIILIILLWYIIYKFKKKRKKGGAISCCSGCALNEACNKANEGNTSKKCDKDLQD